ncbi:gamma-glutamylcyclotransferase [Mesorhizobium sp. USDA-HM6]|nr:gamma-glutamylcyclotransferase [Mesorhizobium sp. USDA-HM6]
MSDGHMALTPGLVSRVHRIVEDSGPLPGLVYHTDEDYDAAVQEILASHSRAEDLWLFAYGSLIWRPEIEHIEERIGTAHGWHRSFCLRLVRWRGTREQPGLMMALDRGGQCKGLVYRLVCHGVEAQLGKLFRREMSVKPSTNMPRWIPVETDEGHVRAVAFVANRSGTGYAGRLTPEETANVLSKACGHWGTCAEYLYNTVFHLEERGIHDRNLWRLQHLVADRIASDHAADFELAM